MATGVKRQGSDAMAESPVQGASDEPRRPAAEAAPKRAGGSPFKLYKPGQGAHVRWCSAAGAGTIALAFGSFIHEQLALFGNLTAQTIVPAALVAGLAGMIFRLIGQTRSVVDFMIATEGEMKKVNWSTRREVFGATKVVIFTVFTLGTFLFLADMVFIVLFESIGVLQIGFLQRLFGGPE